MSIVADFQLRLVMQFSFYWELFLILMTRAYIAGIQIALNVSIN